MDLQFASIARNPSGGLILLSKERRKTDEKTVTASLALLTSAQPDLTEVTMRPVSSGTLAGTGSFKCETCGFAVALHERDEVPDCPSCNGRSFRRTSIFAASRKTATPQSDGGYPDWLEEARDSLSAAGDYLAYDAGDRAVAVRLKEGWTRIGRSLSADVRLDDPTVSRRHALIYSDENGAKVLDDRSLNGVFRNGQRVDLDELVDGDTLTVGRFSLHFITLEGRPARSATRTAGTRG
jgi:DNA-directed RNA polymerase subunit RPC12/RpoP